MLRLALWATITTSWLACADEPREVPLASSTSALTEAECMSSALDGKVEICHKTSSTSNEYTLIKVSTQACVRAHEGHSGDKLAVNGSCAQTCVLVDSFDRADGALAGQSTDTGQSWSGDTVARIIGQAASWEYATVPSSVGTTGSVEVRIANVPSYVNHGIYINYDHQIEDAYLLHIDGATLYLWYFVTGYVLLATTPYVPQVDDVLKVTVDGATIQGYVNGALRLSAPMAAGAFPNGFWVGLYGAGSPDGRVDDFRACGP